MFKRLYICGDTGNQLLWKQFAVSTPEPSVSLPTSSEQQFTQTHCWITEIVQKLSRFFFVGFFLGGGGGVLFTISSRQNRIWPISWTIKLCWYSTVQLLYTRILYLRIPLYHHSSGLDLNTAHFNNTLRNCIIFSEKMF